MRFQPAPVLDLEIISSCLLSEEAPQFGTFNVLRTANNRPFSDVKFKFFYCKRFVRSGAHSSCEIQVRINFCYASNRCNYRLLRIIDVTPDECQLLSLTTYCGNRFCFRENLNMWNVSNLIIQHVRIIDINAQEYRERVRQVNYDLPRVLKYFPSVMC